MARSCLLNARKTIGSQNESFVVVDVSDGDFGFFFFCFFSLFFIFSFSCKDSHEKFTWQASRLSTSGASCSGSRARILYKSAHAKVLFT